jgi:hypothetical protein
VPHSIQSGSIILQPYLYQLTDHTSLTAEIVQPVAPATPAACLDIATCQDQDMGDSSKEPTATEVAAAAAAGGQAAAGAAKAALQEQLELVKAQLSAVLAANGAAPEEEQVRGQDLVLNAELLEQQLQQVSSGLKALTCRVLMQLNMCLQWVATCEHKYPRCSQCRLFFGACFLNWWSTTSNTPYGFLHSYS